MYVCVHDITNGAMLDRHPVLIFEALGLGMASRAAIDNRRSSKENLRTPLACQKQPIDNVLKTIVDIFGQS